MKLEIKKRENGGSGIVLRLRREGKIPAVVYGSDGKSESVFIDKEAFEGCLRGIPQGHLATQVFELSGDVKGKGIVKDIQYHPTTYQILHLDFEKLEPKVLVKVNVPIAYTGVNDCIGIKLGGFLRQVIRAMRVTCLPKDIPSELTLDVSSLGIKQTLRLRDIEMPKGVTPKGKMDEVAVVIAKR